MKNTKETVRELDLNLRHKSGMTSDKFISQYCEVFRKYAYATTDDSLNEFEKEITHVLGMLIYYRRFCEILGCHGEDGTFNSFDPRDFVWEFEDKEDTESKIVKGRIASIMDSRLKVEAVRIK